MKPYKNQIVHYIDNTGKVVPARITSLESDDDGPLTRLETLNRSVIGWVRPHSGERFQYRFIRDPNEMLLAAKDYKGVVIVRSDDPEDTLSHLESLWKDNYTSTLNVRDVSWWLSHDLPAFLCPNRNEVDLVRELDKANKGNIAKPVYLLLKRGGEGLRVIEEDRLFPEAPICDPDEAAELTPEEIEERRQRFTEKTGMTPEEYRKKVDPCVNIRLSSEAAFLTCDTDREKKEENPMEITHALYTGTHIIVILSSNEGISPGVSLIQNGTEWYIEKKTEEGNGWILKGSSIRMPTPKTGPVEVKQNFHFGAMARLGDQKILVHRGDARLPDDVKVGDVFQALFHSHPAYWMVTDIFQDTIITESLSPYSHKFAHRNIPVKRILGIPITITDAIRFAGAILASIKGIDQTLLNRGYIEQDGTCWAISETLSFPLAVGVSLRYDSEDPDESMATAPVPKPGPATFEFNRP